MSFSFGRRREHLQLNLEGWTNEIAHRIFGKEEKEGCQVILEKR